jgi:hypothetical protein
MQKLFYSLLFLITFALADTVVPSDSSDLKITIYNNNLAFVNDMRSVNVQKGRQKLIYEGVPSSVITQSVVPSFLGVETRLYSQNYMYDLVSLSSMLKKSINKEVEFYTNQEPPKRLKGKLLSETPVMVQESQTGDIYTLDSATQVIFSSIPKEMITKPSLLWNIETQGSGDMKIDLKYLTTEISWRSDYVLYLQKDNFDLTGWITVKNNSGVAYKDAQITCLAGDINKFHWGNKRDRVLHMSKSVAMMADEIKEESFSGYHIYKIPFKETIANKEQKQINFIDKKQIAYKQYGVSSNSYFERYKEQKLIFKNTIEFSNTKNNNLGIALPKGIVRMYKKDSEGKTHFIGEDGIGNIPEDENITLSIGDLFDVVGEKRITKYKATQSYRNVQTTYSLRNQSKEKVILKIKENIPVYGNNIKVKTSCKDNCLVKKRSAFEREFTIYLKPKQKYSFTSEFEVIF